MHRFTKYFHRMILLLFILVSAVDGLCQVSLGIGGGITRFSLSGDVPDKAIYQPAYGKSFRLFTDFQLTPDILLSIQPGFSERGTDIAFDINRFQEPVDSIEIRLDYFSVPVVLKIRARESRFYIISGLEIGFLSDASYKTSGSEMNVSEWLSSYDANLHFGVGYGFPNTPSGLVFELRYIQGLYNVIDKNVNDNALQRSKSSGFELIIGYRFNLGQTGK